MRKMNRVFKLLTIIILNVLFTFNVYGIEKQPYVAEFTAPASAKQNSEFTVSFTAKSIEAGFDGYQFVASFDDTKLTLVYDEENDTYGEVNLLNKWDLFLTPNSSSVFSVMGSDLKAPAFEKTSDTKCMTMKFKVLPNASGSTTITFSEIKGSRGNGNPLIAEGSSVTINITDGSTVNPTKSSDATLKSLGVSSGSLSPAFSPSVDTYKVSVGNNVTKLDVSAITNDPKAKVAISGNTNLSVGKNNVIVQVTAEDGTKKNYVIEVTRASGSGSTTYKPTSKSNNADLKNITGIPGLNFDPDKTNYDVVVPFDVTNINVGATPSSSKAKIVISPTKLSDLKVGETQTVTISVKAEDGTLKVYTVNVKRSQYKSETDLEKLKVDDTELNPNSDGEYKITIPSNKTSVSVSAIPKSQGSTVKIIGNNNLKTGNNKVIVQVTDKNGFTKSYIVNVERQKELSFFNFVDKFWYLFLLLPFLIMLVLLYYYDKNKKYLAVLDEKEDEVREKLVENYSPTNIDNKVYISYNSNNSIGYVDNDETDSLEANVDRLLNDSSIPEVERTVNYVKKGVDDIEREYEIKEKLRKK